jgi:HD-like signal output (HDOD) protein
MEKMSSHLIDPIDFDALRRNNTLPSPNGVRLNIMRMCGQEDVSLPDLVMQIQADPALAGRIIKIGNGARLNKGRPIVAVSKDVLLLIGLHAVRQLALAISLATERCDAACSGFDDDTFWARTVAMACAAQALAEHYGTAPPSEMFASGLLANIGTLGLAAARPQAYSALLGEALGQEQLRAAEKARFGYSHLELAAAMMQDWEIPDLFYEAVLHHEAPAQSGFDHQSRQLRLAEMLHVAGAIADYCIATEQERLPALQALLKAGWPLSGEVEHVITICDRVGGDWGEWGALVHIVTHAMPPTRDVMVQLQV